MHQIMHPDATPTPPPDDQPRPPADQRRYPTPGAEAPAPLGVPPTPPAAGGKYTLMDTQTLATGQQVPVAWSPCRPIHYVIDVTGAPADFRDNVHTAVNDVSAATGLVFVDDGLTVEAADTHREAFLPNHYGDRWAPVLIRFADEETVEPLAGNVAGVASPMALRDPTTETLHFVSGSIYLDRETLAYPAVSGEPDYLGVLRHELGHVVGLNHVSDETQLMNPVSSDFTTYQSGDLQGLSKLGAGTCAPGL